MEEIFRFEIDHKLLLEELEERLNKMKDGGYSIEQGKVDTFADMLHLKILLIRDAVQKGVKL